MNCALIDGEGYTVNGEIFMEVEDQGDVTKFVITDNKIVKHVAKLVFVEAEEV